jgi:methionyl-tRNA formyltransferase
MGTPPFAVPALRAIAAAHDVVCVYSQPPRPAGRGKKDRSSAVQVVAEELGLVVRHPAGLKSQAAQQEFAALKADVAVVVAYGLILPPAILDAPAQGCLNIHASLLPRWRGAAPIQRAIMAGDSETGLCIMRMDEGLDTGPVLLRQTLTIGAQDTAADLQQRLADAGAALVLTALAGLGEIVAVPQPEQGITYAAKITKDEARIDWNQQAAQVDRQIRGLSPFPGAWCSIAGERVKLLRSRLADGSGAPGEVLHEMVIACGTGAIEVLEAQREGRRPATAADILRGFALPAKLA